MNLGLALEILLLRQMWVVRKLVPEAVYREVAESLTIDRNRDAYTLGWQRKGRTFEKAIPRSSFSFYERGDTADATGADGQIDENNRNQARVFALEALGLDDDLRVFDAPKRSWPREEALSLLWCVLVCALAAVVGDRAWNLAGVLLIVLAVEYVPFLGRLLSVVCVAGFAALGLPAMGFVMGTWNIVAQFLDPNAFLRRFRVLAAAAVAGQTLVVMADQIPSSESLVHGSIALVVAVPLIVVDLTLGSHFRVQRIALPLASVGALLSGFTSVAVVLILSSAVSLAGRLLNPRLLSMQSERTLTPNG